MAHTSSIEELKSLDQKIEDAKNRLTVIEEDSMRFGRLVESERYTWSELKKANEEVQSQVYNYSSQRDSLVKEIADLQLEKESLNADIASSRGTFVEINKSIDEISMGHSARASILDQKETILSERETDLSKKEKEVSEKDADLSDKHSKIRDFANTL